MWGDVLMTTSVDLRRVEIEHVRDIRRAAENLRDIAAALAGFKVVTVADIASKKPMVDADGHILGLSVFGFTAPQEQWWRNPRMALESPQAIACRYESDPFWVNRQGYRTRQPNSYLQAIDLTNFERRALTRAMIVVPIHLPFGQIGMVGYGIRGRADLSAEYEAHADMLALLGTRFISGYAKAMRTHEPVPAACQLTKREIACLRLAAVGKTDREIGAILERSHATVRFHIHNAAGKLGAINRSQTVYKAGQLGYLGLTN